VEAGEERDRGAGTAVREVAVVVFHAQYNACIGRRHVTCSTLRGHEPVIRFASEAAAEVP